MGPYVKGRMCIHYKEKNCQNVRKLFWPILGQQDHHWTTQNRPSKISDEVLGISKLSRAVTCRHESVCPQFALLEQEVVAKFDFTSMNNTRIMTTTGPQLCFLLVSRYCPLLTLFTKHTRCRSEITLGKPCQNVGTLQVFHQDRNTF
jgi:hypothetical protein